jgi:hypothetical protein
MATKEEIKEYYSGQRWSVVQGIIIFFLVVGFSTNATVIDLLSFVISSCFLGLILAKAIWWLISKVIKESLKHSPNWYLRLFPTIFHLTLFSFI